MADHQSMNPVKKIGIGTGVVLTCEEKIYSVNIRPSKWFITIFYVAFNSLACRFMSSVQRRFIFLFKKIDMLNSNGINTIQI